MFAVIQTGGKQYRVSAGQKVKIEKLDAEAGGDFVFDKVLLIATQTNADSPHKSALGPHWSVFVGTPYVVGAQVEAKVLKQGRDKKKIVFRYHSKTRYRKKKGHRQHFTEIQILDIK